ncbi:MAG: GNAT family N-acetyltransferase [Candidatus Hodarchaeales archaeon]|jgi:GNAT superfamily N-acetyltransferase
MSILSKRIFDNTNNLELSEAYGSKTCSKVAVIMIDNITIRKATTGDITTLVRLRRMMFEAMGFEDPTQLEASDKAAKNYFSKAIPAGQFHGWLAVTSKGSAVGAGGVVIDQHPPGPENLSGRIGYIMNLVTIPPYRRRGIARRIMQMMLEWLEEQGIQIQSLHATVSGRSLYEELGFIESNEMRRK